MAADSGESSSIRSLRVREDLSSTIGLPGALAIGSGTIAVGIFVLSGVAVNNGDLRD